MLIEEEKEEGDFYDFVRLTVSVVCFWLYRGLSFTRYCALFGVFFFSFFFYFLFRGGSSCGLSGCHFFPAAGIILNRNSDNYPFPVRWYDRVCIFPGHGYGTWDEKKRQK